MFAKNKIPLIIIWIVFCLTQISVANCQFYTNAPLAVYFNCPAFSNPGYAGIDRQNKLTAYAASNKGWTDFNGALSNATLFIGVPFGMNSGIGLSLGMEQIEPIKKTSVVLTYAYHIPIVNESSLSMGISAGLISSQIDPFEILDPVLLAANNNFSTMDASFGLVYRKGGFVVSGSFLNMASALSKARVNSIADLPKGFLSLRYDILLNKESGLLFSPISTVRLFQGTKNPLFVFGSQLSKGIFSTNLLYQNTGSWGGGITLFLENMGVKICIDYVGNNRYGVGQAYELGLDLQIHKK